MFRKILVPIDLTNRHDRALAIATEMAGSPKAEVILLHIIQQVHGLTQEDDPAFYQKLEELSHRHMDEWVDRVQSQSIQCQGVIRIGERGPEIVRYARETQCDLIILASHPVDVTAPGAEWVSLSYLISIGSPCSVLLVK